MTSSRYWPLVRMSLQYSLIFFRAERAEHAGFHDLGEADDGVQRRAQFVAHVGEEFRFGEICFLGAVLFLRIFLGEHSEFNRLRLQRLLRGAQVGDGGNLPALAFYQLFLVHLDRRDVGADRHVAAVLGALLADMCSQRPSSRLDFKCARTKRLDAIVIDLLVGPRGLRPAASTAS